MEIYDAQIVWLEHIKIALRFVKVCFGAVKFAFNMSVRFICVSLQTSPSTIQNDEQMEPVATSKVWKLECATYKF